MGIQEEVEHYFVMVNALTIKCSFSVLIEGARRSISSYIVKGWDITYFVVLLLNIQTSFSYTR